MTSGLRLSQCYPTRGGGPNPGLHHPSGVDFSCSRPLPRACPAPARHPPLTLYDAVHPVSGERRVVSGSTASYRVGVGARAESSTGWVHSDDESHHAVTLTRGVPGVDTVVNRLVVREEEDRLDESARRYENGDVEASPRWEGMGVGIGRPRQGT